MDHEANVPDTGFFEPLIGAKIVRVKWEDVCGPGSCNPSCQRLKIHFDNGKTLDGTAEMFILSSGILPRLNLMIGEWKTIDVGHRTNCPHLEYGQCGEHDCKGKGFCDPKAKCYSFFHKPNQLTAETLEKAERGEDVEELDIDKLAEDMVESSSTGSDGTCAEEDEYLKGSMDRDESSDEE
jgi:hypothetical protein